MYLKVTSPRDLGISPWTIFPVMTHFGGKALANFTIARAAAVSGREPENALQYALYELTLTWYHFG